MLSPGPNVLRGEARAILIVVAIVLTVVLVSYFGLRLLIFRGRSNVVTRQKLEQIEEGMSRAEILNMLGPPHGGFGDQIPQETIYYQCEYPSWFSIVDITFDEQDRVKWISM